VRRIKLCDICDFQGGSQPPKNQWIDSPQYGYIRMLQIRDFTQSEKVKPEYIKITSSSKVCNEDDILIARYGASVGKILTGLAGAYNVAIMKTIPDEEKISKRFLFYFLSSQYFQNYIMNVGSRAAQAGFNKDDLQGISLKEYSLKEQADICSILDEINVIIKKRKKQLKYIENVVKSRFIEMFGDENNSKKWDIVNVENVADVQVGVVIKPSQYYTDKNEGIKAFRSLNVGEGYIKDSEWVYFSKEGHQKNSKSILKENDLLIVRSGTPGTACVVTKDYVGSNTIDLIIAHPNCEKVNPYYLCTFTNMPHGKKQISEGIGGAAQQHFNVGKYNKLKLMLPPMKIQNKFVEFLREIDKSKHFCEMEVAA
jgi:type I restriction enzyme S subunit